MYELGYLKRVVSIKLGIKFILCLVDDIKRPHIVFFHYVDQGMLMLFHKWSLMSTLLSIRMKLDSELQNEITRFIFV